MTDSEKKVSHVSHFCKFYDTPPPPLLSGYTLCSVIYDGQNGPSTFVLLKAFAIKKE